MSIAKYPIYKAIGVRLVSIPVSWLNSSVTTVTTASVRAEEPRQQCVGTLTAALQTSDCHTCARRAPVLSLKPLRSDGGHKATCRYLVFRFCSAGCVARNSPSPQQMRLFT